MGEFSFWSCHFPELKNDLPSHHVNWWHADTYSAISGGVIWWMRSTIIPTEGYTLSLMPSSSKSRKMSEWHVYPDMHAALPQYLRYLVHLFVSIGYYTPYSLAFTTIENGTFSSARIFIRWSYSFYRCSKPVLNEQSPVHTWCMWVRPHGIVLDIPLILRIHPIPMQEGQEPDPPISVFPE